MVCTDPSENIDANRIFNCCDRDFATINSNGVVHIAVTRMYLLAVAQQKVHMSKLWESNLQVIKLVVITICPVTIST
jgi:hypothetical protein